uniref:Uncharacterized protein n=1 Tax=Globodera rostochiensis TaxID=31243 RepID=A0A914IEZ4_GLORO
MFARLNTVILLIALISPISTDDNDEDSAEEKKCCSDCYKSFKYCCIECALNDTESEVCVLNCRIDLGNCSYKKCHLFVCTRPDDFM